MSAGVDVAEQIVPHLGERGSLGNSFDNAGALFRELLKEDPEQGWNVIQQGFQTDKGEFWLKRWLSRESHTSDDNAPILEIPGSVLWDWVESDPENHAPLLASCLPSGNANEWWSFARPLLVRYGDDDNVTEALSNNHRFGQGGMGSLSDPYSEQRETFESYLEGENDSNVRQWLNNEIRILSRRSSTGL